MAQHIGKFIGTSTIHSNFELQMLYFVVDDKLGVDLRCVINNVLLVHLSAAVRNYRVVWFLDHMHWLVRRTADLGQPRLCLVRIADEHAGVDNDPLARGCQAAAIVLVGFARVFCKVSACTVQALHSCHPFIKPGFGYNLRCLVGSAVKQPELVRVNIDNHVFLPMRRRLHLDSLMTTQRTFGDRAVKLLKSLLAAVIVFPQNAVLYPIHFGYGHRIHVC